MRKWTSRSLHLKHSWSFWVSGSGLARRGLGWREKSRSCWHIAGNEAPGVNRIVWRAKRNESEWNVSLENKGTLQFSPHSGIRTVMCICLEKTNTRNDLVIDSVRIMLIAYLTGKFVTVFGNMKIKPRQSLEVGFWSALVHFTDALPFEVDAKTSWKADSWEFAVHGAAASWLSGGRRTRDTRAAKAKNKTWSSGHINPAWQTGPLALVITLVPPLCVPFPLSLKTSFL